MDSSKIYQHFIDPKLEGLDKISSSCLSNLSTINKFLKIFKDFHYAQDVYVKSLSKININLIQLCNDESDLLNPILNLFSLTICIFTNVQNEFGMALHKIIRNLINACEDNSGIFGKIFTSSQMNIINNLKSAEFQLNKSKQKYFSICNLCSGTSAADDKNDKAIKRVKEQYQISVANYNKARINFLDVFDDGINLLRENHFAHLENARRCTKSFGNALAKLVFDMKESVDSVKQFYKSFNKEDIFQSWIQSNKTVSDTKIESFSEAVLENPEKVNFDGVVSDQDNVPPEKLIKKGNESRKMSLNILSNSSITTNDPNNSNNQNLGVQKNFEKSNVAAVKSQKKRRSLFSNIMKFKSTSNLAEDDKSIEEERDVVDSWQSRNNFNEDVLVDEEGFIIRDNANDESTRLSESSFSSSSSSDNRLKGLKKLHIKPINELSTKSDTNSELMTVAKQLPLPYKEKNKLDVSKRVSNLQRSSRPVSYLTRDKLYRRSLSVSELEHMRNEFDSPVENDSSNKTNVSTSIPIACAITEVISSNLSKGTNDIRGQITLAFPLNLKRVFQDTPINKLPKMISFRFKDNSSQIISTQITKQLEDIVKLESTDNNVYTISIITESLKKNLINESNSKIKFQASNRISLPILEYMASISDFSDKIIHCQARWAVSQMPNVQFDFIISSSWFQDNKPLIVKLKLCTDGYIEEIFCKDDIILEKLNSQCWKIHYDKSKSRISVKIRTLNEKNVKLKMNHEFTFEKLSLIKPSFSLITENLSSNINFKMTLLHYRTLSTGNLCELFEYDIH